MAGVPGLRHRRRSVSAALYWILSFAFSAISGAFGPAREDLLADPRPGPMVLPGLLAHPIAFGGYTGYDYVPHARGGRTLGKKAMKPRLVPYDGVAPRAARPVKWTALQPAVLITADIPRPTLR